MATKPKKQPNSQLDSRIWVQANGVGPADAMAYMGASNRGYTRGGDLGFPIAGRTNIVRPSPDQFGQFAVVGQSREAPEQATFPFEIDVMRSQLGLLVEMAEDDVPIGIHIHLGRNSASNKDNWDSKIVIPYADLATLSLPAVGAADSDESLTWNGELSYSDINMVTKVSWTQLIASTIVQNVPATAFGRSRSYAYAVEKGDGAAVVPKLHYTSNFGSTWANTNLTGWTHSEHPADMIYIDGFIVICSNDAGAYMYFQEDAITSPTEVTSGITATKEPNAIFGFSFAETFMCGDAGYIYKIPGIGKAAVVVDAGISTAQNLNHIDGMNDTIVAVGAANALVYSTDRGETWQAGTGPIPATVLIKVQVLTDDMWVVAAADGNCYYTLNRGTTWTAMSFEGSGTGSVTAVTFSKKNPAFGLLGHKTAAPLAAVFRTTDGGNTWERITLTGYPSSQEVSKFAIWDANTMLAAGVATGGTDGILAMAKTSRMVRA